MATLLVVDDDEMIRRLVSTTLESAGNRIIPAANGAEAVAVYRSYANQIDLIVTDVNMPVMDGLQEILRRVYAVFHERKATPEMAPVASEPAPRRRRTWRWIVAAFAGASLVVI